MLSHAYCTTFSLWHWEGLVVSGHCSCFFPTTLPLQITLAASWGQDPSPSTGASPGGGIQQQSLHYSKAVLSSPCPLWLHASSALELRAQTSPEWHHPPTSTFHLSLCIPDFFLGSQKSFRWVWGCPEVPQHREPLQVCLQSLLRPCSVYSKDMPLILVTLHQSLPRENLGYFPQCFLRFLPWSGQQNQTWFGPLTFKFLQAFEKLHIFHRCSAVLWLERRIGCGGIQRAQKQSRGKLDWESGI